MVPSAFASVALHRGSVGRAPFPECAASQPEPGNAIGVRRRDSVFAERHLVGRRRATADRHVVLGTVPSFSSGGGSFGGGGASGARSSFKLNSFTVDGVQITHASVGPLTVSQVTNSGRSECHHRGWSSGPTERRQVRCAQRRRAPGGRGRAAPPTRLHRRRWRTAWLTRSGRLRPRIRRAQSSRAC